MTYRALGLGDGAHEADRGHEGQGNGESLHCGGCLLDDNGGERTPQKKAIQLQRPKDEKELN